jgi:dTDP-4-amino-4,6-dideoxygalactose transaminase
MKSHTESKTTSYPDIPITKPVFDQAEVDAIQEVLRSGWVVQGPQVARFEQMMAEFTGSRFAVATTSGTTALHLALCAAGIGSGDEVLLPSFTFIATANAVEYTGARPVFVDIDLDTFTMDPSLLEQALARRRSTRCVVPVSLFGLCADMNAINTMAGKHNLTVIEDAACGLSAFRDGHHAGTEALAGCFSFHPRKAVTTGEGGMVITDNAQLADKIVRMRDHGASQTDLERHFSEGGSLLPDYDMLGYNYRMTDIQGALGVVQMGKVRTVLDQRREAAIRYDQLLKDASFLRLPHTPEGMIHAYQSYVCLFGADQFDFGAAESPDWELVARLNRDRNRMMARLEAEGIAVRQGTHAVHTLGYYRNKYGIAPHDYPNSLIADRLSVTLPLYAGMSEKTQMRVVDALQRLHKQSG